LCVAAAKRQVAIVRTLEAAAAMSENANP